MSNSLILLTDSFPYGTSETFLENELPILASSFAHILILPTHTTGEKRPLPENVKVDLLLLAGTDVPGFLRTMQQLFSRDFYQELQHIRQQYLLPISVLSVKQCLSSLARAKRIAQRLHHWIQQNEWQTDNLVFYSYWADETAVALSLLKKKLPTVKIITRTHGWELYFERRNTGFIPFRHLLFQHIDGVYCIAADGRQYLSKKFPTFADKFHLSRLGTLKGRALPAAPPANPFLLVSTSNLIPLKRVHLIIETLRHLAQPIRWVHFGDGPERQQLAQQAAQMLSDKPQVAWEFKGRVPNQQVLDFYREEQPHLFINVSTTEGLPVSIMEAMAHSIPVLATDVGGTQEIVHHQRNGWLLPADLTSEQLAARMLAIVSMEATTMQKFRQEAYNTWAKEFNATVNFQRFAAALQQL